MEARNFITENDLQGVQFSGPLPPQQAWEMVARCHLGLAILKNSPNYVESYPTKMFEYMGLGLPVVASDFPLYRDIVEKNNCGFLVAPEDPEALATLLIRAYKNQSSISQISDNALMASKTYEWNTEFQKLQDFYVQVLET